MVFIPVVFLAWSFYLIFTRVVQVPLRKAAFILDEEKLQVNLHCAQACSISGLLVGSRRHSRPNQHWAAQLRSAACMFAYACQAGCQACQGIMSMGISSVQARAALPILSPPGWLQTYGSGGHAHLSI